AQSARGFRARGMRGWTPLLVPLISGGMERALTLAEVLESRGFGGQSSNNATAGTCCRDSTALVIGLASATTGAYLLANGRIMVAATALTLGAISLGLGSLKRDPRIRAQSHYRPRSWTRASKLTLTLVTLSVVMTLVSLSLEPSSFRYDPYPTIAMPRMDLLALMAAGFLFVPAVAAIRPEVGCS
nr:energy-coupling factor transporter transmembrane protein EcfT [Chloroflexota bacterium]